MPQYPTDSTEAAIGSDHDRSGVNERALPSADPLVRAVENVRDVKTITFAGSRRRMKETAGDIDLLATSTEPAAVIKAFAGLRQIAEVLERMKLDSFTPASWVQGLVEGGDRMLSLTRCPVLTARSTEGAEAASSPGLI
jgi:hypothetical protein